MNETLSSETLFDQWSPITDDDEVIKSALEEANIPCLMNTLVHLTGDLSIIRSDIKPVIDLFGDAQCGISESDQARIRELAFDAIRQYRDERISPKKPDSSTVHEMINFMTGAQLNDDYVSLLEAELSLNGEDPYAQPLLFDIPAGTRGKFKVVVIGAGMSGLLAGIRLKEAGIPFIIIEKNDDVGGTWYENTYPGCRVDSPNHTYSYSFAPRDWPQHFSPQPVLLEYFRSVTEEYGLREHIRFQTEVISSRFDEEKARWFVSVKSADGSIEDLETQSIVAAVGQLNRPKYPDVKGVGSFAGPAFHSARWEHAHELKGKRIGVIGTGGSAFQFVPIIAQHAESVTVFQRTPPWVSIRPEYQDDIPDGKHWLLRHLPYYAKWFRFFNFWRTSEGILGAVKSDPAWNEQRSVSPENDQLRELLTGFIHEMLSDRPELIDVSVPEYPPAGKRMLVDNGTWLTALKRENLNLVTDAILEITPGGVKTEQQEHEFDVLIYGTGFHANKFLWPMEFIGRDGRSLTEDWQQDPRAYLGVTVPGYPNLFLMYGPNTNIVVNGSIIFFSECEMRYILGCIALLLSRDVRALDCREDVHNNYNQKIDAGNLQMAWGSPHVNSWYKNESGRVTQNWPFTLLEFWQQTRAPDPADFYML